MNYSEVKNRLLSKEMNISMPGTERISKVLLALNNPNKDLNVVHVVGTNGKGSTSTMMANILSRCGLKVGLFNSPFITELTEYISYSIGCKKQGAINDDVNDASIVNISRDDFADLASEIFLTCDKAGVKLTHFEFITVLAVLFFREINCDICILEAGLGGRYDATNIFEKDVCTIMTAISLEHTGVLGNTIEEIVENKAGICCKGGTIISSDAGRRSATGECIREYCKNNALNLIDIELDLVKNIRYCSDSISFDYKSYKDILINTQAAYQVENCALAISGCEYIEDKMIITKSNGEMGNAHSEIDGMNNQGNITPTENRTKKQYCRQTELEEAIKSGISAFSLRSRFEIIRNEPEIIIDGAHNPACAGALVTAVKTRKKQPDRGYYIVTGVMADKDIDGIYEALDEIACGYIVVDNGYPRAMRADRLSHYLEGFNKPVINAGNTEVAAAIIKCFQDKGVGFIFAGTLYMSDAFRNDCIHIFDDKYVEERCNEAINRLTSKSFYSANSNLPDMKRLLEEFDSPQEKIKYIHIAGTNGKGSTSKLLYELIHRNGISTGLFTSPYIEVFNERIQLDGKCIEPELLYTICFEVIDSQNRLRMKLNQFALLTCIAFIYYKIKNADMVVLETGLGGEFDPTNIITKPLCCVITNIGLDHTKVLGDTISEIAAAKAGIIKKNVPVICYPVCDEARKVIASRAEGMGAPYTCIDASEVVINTDGSFDFESHVYNCALAGDFQCLNAANAIKAYEYIACNDKRLNNSYKHIQNALENTIWKGRLEKICDKPLTYVDGGHNPQCIENVTKFISSKYEDRRKIYIAGFMKDKAYNEMVRILKDNSEELHLVPVNYNRSLNTFELTNLLYEDKIEVYVNASLDEAYGKAVKSCGDDGVIIIIGSLYQLKDAYKIVKGV